MGWPHVLQHGFALSFGADAGAGSGIDGAKSNYNEIDKYQLCTIHTYCIIH